jgi:hypothetical protein
MFIPGVDEACFKDVFDPILIERPEKNLIDQLDTSHIKCFYCFKLPILRSNVFPLNSSIQSKLAIGAHNLRENKKIDTKRRELKKAIP